MKRVGAEVVCLSRSVYSEALTRGHRYTVLAARSDALRVVGDNGRARWFPDSCFAGGDARPPVLESFHIDDPLDVAHERCIEVTVHLSDGQRRWCVFATPAALAECGDWIEGTRIPFHYGCAHYVIASELTADLIGRMLEEIDQQGRLIDCSLSLAIGPGD